MVFTPQEVQIFKSKNTKVVSTRTTSLWRIPLLQTELGLINIKQKDQNSDKQNSINSVYELPSTNQVIHYYHAVAGFPTKPTWLKAIKAGIFTSWSMLTATAIAKHISESQETHKGHMPQQWQGVQSNPKKTVAEDMHIVHAPPHQSKKVSINIEDMKQLMYMDQTGKFV